jgi:hypothetical protein
MSVGLIYEGGTAILEGIPLTIRQGKAVTGDVDVIILEDSSLNPNVQNISPANKSTTNFWGFVRENPILVFGTVLGIGILIVTYLGGVAWKKRRLERKNNLKKNQRV